jgi:hypothetical protein
MMKKFLIQIIIFLVKIFIRLPLGLLSGVCVIIRKLAPDPEFKQILTEVIDILKAGPPQTDLVKSMILEAKKQDLYALLEGAIFSVD